MQTLYYTSFAFSYVDQTKKWICTWTLRLIRHGTFVSTIGTYIIQTNKFKRTEQKTERAEPEKLWLGHRSKTASSPIQNPITIIEDSRIYSSKLSWSFILHYSSDEHHL